MYSPSLNVSLSLPPVPVPARADFPTPSQTSLALNVDATAAVDAYVVSIAAELVPGPGYQLFFSQPGNADVVYADSVVFSVGTDVAPSTGSISTSLDLDGQSSAISSISTSAVSTTSYAAVTTSSVLTTSASSIMVTSVRATSTAVSTSASPSSITSSTAAASTLQPAKIVGGTQDQGLGLLSESSAPHGVRLSSALVASVAAGAAAVTWLL